MAIMIAAQALVHLATIVMRDAGDYADVPNLSLLSW
jgi:predicted nucleic acid-binding protein